MQIARRLARLTMCRSGAEGFPFAGLNVNARCVLANHRSACGSMKTPVPTWILPMSVLGVLRDAEAELLLAPTERDIMLATLNSVAQPRRRDAFEEEDDGVALCGNQVRLSEFLRRAL